MSLKTSSSFGLGAFLKDTLLDTTSLGKANLRSGSASNDKAIGQTRAKDLALGVLDGNNGKGSFVLLNVHKSSNTTAIVSLGKHDHGTQFKFQNIRHFSSINRHFDRVIDFDIRVGESNGASVVCHADRDLSGRNVNLDNTAELELSLLAVQPLQYESSLDVKQDTEAVVALFERDNVHESSGEVVVGTDLAVDLDTAFHADLHALLVGQSVLELVTKDNTHRDAFTKFVRSLGRTGGKNSHHLSEAPFLGRVETLQVLLWSARPMALLIGL